MHETTADAGPIAYVRGSNHWGVSPPSRAEFHAPEDWLAGVRDAQPADVAELEIVPVVVKAGGGAFHHNATWHGSEPNRSGTVARMALVSHMLPSNARFHETNVDLNYSRYRRRGDLSMDESFFPVLWDRDGYRTPWLAELPDIDTRPGPCFAHLAGARAGAVGAFEDLLALRGAVHRSARPRRRLRSRRAAPVASSFMTKWPPVACTKTEFEESVARSACVGPRAAW